MAEVLTIISIILGITLFLIFIYYTLHNVRINGESYQEQKFRQHFNNLHGDAFDDEAKMAIREAKRIRDIRPIDRYRLGVVHLINEQNHQAAAQEFQTVIDDMIEQKINRDDIDNREAIFIVDRIQDFQELFMEDLELNGIETILNILANEIFQRQTEEVKRPKIEIADNDPEKAQKKILAEQKWFSDPQNVHDRVVMKEFADQFKKVAAENACGNLTKHSYAEVKSYMFGRVAMGTEQTAKVHNLFAVLDENYPVFFDSSIREQAIITAIWQRIHDEGNAANSADMKNALLDAICDCTEGGVVVCATGRPLKLWQSLALLDKDPSIGTVSNKQIVRNEILEQAAKWADEILNEAPPHVKLAYDKNEDNEEVKELIESIHKKFEDIKKIYQGKLDDVQLSLVIEQCKQCV